MDKHKAWATTIVAPKLVDCKIMEEHSIRWEKQCAKATYNKLCACSKGECIDDPDNIREAL